MTYTSEDIGSDANRAAAQIGGAIGGAFLGQGFSSAIQGAGNQISSIVDNASGRKDREDAAAFEREKIRLERVAELEKLKIQREAELAALRAQIPGAPPVPGLGAATAAQDEAARQRRMVELERMRLQGEAELSVLRAQIPGAQPPPMVAGRAVDDVFYPRSSPPQSYMVGGASGNVYLAGGRVGGAVAVEGSAGLGLAVVGGVVVLGGLGALYALARRKRSSR